VTLHFALTGNAFPSSFTYKVKFTFNQVDAFSVASVNTNLPIASSKKLACVWVGGSTFALTCSNIAPISVATYWFAASV